uniref:Platelet endothelial aggregation receptor 1-like n=1 Tax=Crassostrea virginica TaxID=6565 RepID=A0A8B8AXE4_CRAVI|nr:platelet endothelial aggregation receptor 1-like [Crassostrea virginica]
MNNTCTPCKVGYFGIGCHQCPPSHFGKNCASECNCTKKEACHHVHGCRNLQDRMKDSTLLVTVSLKSIHSTIMKGLWKEVKSTSLVVTNRRTVMDENGGKNCTNKKKHLTFPTVAVSVVLACFTAISGLFLIFYLGLHYYVTKKKPIAAVF